MTSSGWTSFAAFKVPSASMCPTICSGERIVADLGAYRSKSPERGALVLLQHRFSPALFIKRVVGLPGDIVGPGLSTGKRSYFPRCVAPLFQQKYDPADYSMFNSRRVPEGTFFVVGDSLGNSFDSRIPGFGPVVLGDMRGKPIFLYWSLSRSRIGCTIR
jgi:signal peptidase I